MHAESTVKRCTAGLSVAIMAIYGAYMWWIFNFVSRPGTLGTVLFNCLFCLTVWSYLRTAFTDPGTPQSHEWRAWAQSSANSTSGEREELFQGQHDLKQQRPLFCCLCKAERPERAHHCRVTGTCILRMDHYCVLAGNCIGWRNHKHFLLLTLYGFLTCFVFLSAANHPSTLRNHELPHVMWIHTLHQGWIHLGQYEFRSDNVIFAVGWRNDQYEYCEDLAHARANSTQSFCPLPRLTAQASFHQPTRENADGLLHDVGPQPWRLFLHTYGPSSPYDAPALACGAKCVTVLFLLGNLWFLLANGKTAVTGTTTVEACMKGQNPWQLSSVAANVVQMMGVPGLQMFLPVQPVGRCCNGVQFSVERSARGPV